MKHLGLKEILAQRKKTRAAMAKWDAMAQLDRYKAVIGGDIAEGTEEPEKVANLQPKSHFGN